MKYDDEINLSSEPIYAQQRQKKQMKYIIVMIQIWITDLKEVYQ